MRSINRRDVLRIGGIAISETVLAWLLGARADAFAQTTVPNSTSGLHDWKLESGESRLAISGKTLSLLTYNQSFNAPVLRAKEGDTIRLTYTNRLNKPSNLHLHGLAISPEIDQPMLEVQPSQSHTYAFELPKGSGGTHWYHPHVHGLVAQQMAAGLVGALLVDSDLDAMSELKAAEEHLLVLKDLAVVGEQIKNHDMMDWMNGQEGNLQLVNGAYKPTLRPQKATLRLRLISASNARYHRLKLEQHPMYLIATDGGFLEKPVMLEELLLAPGERAEVMVQLTRTGSYRLQNLPYARGIMMMGGMGGMNMPDNTQPVTLLTIVAPNNPKLTPLPTGFRSIEPLNLSKVQKTRRIVFSEKMMQARFFFNNRSFDPARIDFTGKLDSLEIWELQNLSDMDHPFHLHSYPFQIIDRNGKPEPYRAWKDVVNLKKNDLVRIAVPLSHFTGLTVFHCHIVEHEDRGMMGTLEVRR